jgi:hypothetical protein
MHISLLKLFKFDFEFDFESTLGGGSADRRDYRRGNQAVGGGDRYRY